jgi:4-amino-4-deoxy-L-arabinose transferase-like glycosyltransferase
VPRALLAVIGVSLALNATAIWWGLPSRFGWAIDELNPSVILDGIDVRFSGDWHQPAYPPLHYYLLAASYVPVLGLDLVEPRSVEGHTLFFYFGRLLSLAMGMGVLLFVYRVSKALFDKTSGVFAAATVALSAPFVYYGKTANLDVPVTFWALLSLVFFLRVVERDDLKSYLFFTITAVLAMLTKDQAFSFYVLPLLVFAVRRFRREGSFARAFFDRRATLSLVVGLAAFLLLHNVVFNFQGFVHHFEEILWARRHYSEFEGGATNQLGLLLQTGRHLAFSLGWPLAIACGFGIILARKSPLAPWLLLSGASYYLFFIAPVLSTWLRYSVPLVAMLAPFGGKLAAELWRLGPALRSVVVLAFLYSLARALSVNALLLQDSRYSSEEWLRKNVGRDEVVGYMGAEYYLPRLHELRNQRLRPTESVLEREHPDFLVINRDYVGRYASGSREGELFAKLFQGRTSYGLVYASPSGSTWSILDFEGLLANMSKISPPIEIYQLAESTREKP